MNQFIDLKTQSRKNTWFLFDRSKESASNYEYNKYIFSFKTIERKIEQLHQYASVGFPHGIPTELDIETALGVASYTENIPLPKIKVGIYIYI